MSLRSAASLLLPVLFCVLVLPAGAMAQAPAKPPAPAPAPAQAPKPAPAPVEVRGTERVVIIDMQSAIAGCNEGQRDLGALVAKLQPRQAELQKLSAELEGLKKQFNTVDPAQTVAARDALAKSIDTKTKTLQRSAEDWQKDRDQQQNEIAQRILQKLAPVLKKYVDDHGYGLVLDASAPWPQGPVVMATPAVDITAAIVAAYNAASGVPAPPKPVK